MEFGDEIMNSPIEIIRNISRTGRRNRLYGGIGLITSGVLLSIFLYIIDYHHAENWVLFILFGLYCGGSLTLLEAKTQVCVYHGILGTHESSNGMKKHSDQNIATACRKKSSMIIIQSFLIGILMTYINIFLIFEII